MFDIPISYSIGSDPFWPRGCVDVTYISDKTKQQSWDPQVQLGHVLTCIILRLPQTETNTGELVVYNFKDCKKYIIHVVE